MSLFQLTALCRSSIVVYSRKFLVAFLCCHFAFLSFHYTNSWPFLPNWVISPSFSLNLVLILLWNVNRGCELTTEDASYSGYLVLFYLGLAFVLMLRLVSRKPDTSPGKLRFQKYNHDIRDGTIQTVYVYPLFDITCPMGRGGAKM